MWRLGLASRWKPVAILGVAALLVAAAVVIAAARQESREQEGLVYWQNEACTDVPILDTPLSRLIWCVDSVTVTDEGRLEVAARWTLEHSYTAVDVRPDRDRHSIHLDDNLGNRYEHVDTAGVTRYGGRIEPDGEVRGVLVFPRPQPGGTVFALRDDKHVIQGLSLDPERRTSGREIAALLGHIRQADQIEIVVAWGGLGPAFRTIYTLVKSGRGYTASKRSDDDRRLGESVPVAGFDLPVDEVEAFLRTLSQAPAHEGAYVPVFTHTDDYPTASVSIVSGDDLVVFHSESQGRGLVPWSASVGGRSYVVPDDTPGRALGRLLHVLDPETDRDLGLRALYEGAGGESSDDEDRLRLAVQSGDVESIIALVGADPDRRFSRDQETALTIAVFNERSDAVRALLEAGADPDVVTPRGSALLLAARLGNRESMRLLLAAGADPSLRPDGQSTAVEAAAAAGHVDLARELLAGGARLMTEGRESIWYAAGARNDVATLRALMESGDGTCGGSTSCFGAALNVGIANGHSESVNLLLQQVERYGGLAAHGGSALLWAASARRTEVVQTLVEMGADVNEALEVGTTPLMRASTPDVAKQLLEAGANINAGDDAGRTALMLAASVRIGGSYYGHVYNQSPLPDHLATVLLLIESGADLDACDENGRTALIHAVGAVRPYRDTIRALVEAGADVDVVDEQGMSAYAYASNGATFRDTRGRPNAVDPEAVRILQEAGAATLSQGPEN